MLDASYSVTAASFRTPWPVFTVAWPAELELPGCLVTCMLYEEAEKKFQRLGTEAGCGVVVAPSPGSQWSIELFFVTRETQDGRPVTQRLCVGNTQLVSVLASQSEFEKSIPSRSGSLFLLQTARDLAYRLLRAVCGLCVYCIAFPDALRDGVPEGVRRREIRRLDPVCTTVGATHVPAAHNGDRKAVSMHYRRAHFRELRHERFKRDELGRIRIVPVDACVVGAVHPHTVEEQ